MTDRRRAPRYVMCAAVPAELAPLQDILVERIDDERVIAICPETARPAENLAVQFNAPGGDIVSVDVDVISSEPVLHAGRLSFRVRLQASGALATVREAQGAVTPDSPLHAVLARRHAVGIRNISGVGCLVDAYVPFERGAIALLETCIGDRRCIEAARITRADAAVRGTFLVGAEFLPLSPAGATSVRAAIATLDGRGGARG